MLTRTAAAGLGGVALALASWGPVQAQVHGHVVLEGGPIGVSVVFGQQPEAVVVRDRVLYRSAVPAQYRRGMRLEELERYLFRIEVEYDHFRRMHPADAYLHLGWSERQLRDYVHWLRDERRYLRNERKRLERALRGWRAPGRGWDDDWDRGRDRNRGGRGRGR